MQDPLSEGYTPGNIMFETTAYENLFNIDDTSELFHKEKAAAVSLYIAQKFRSDIATPLSFLCTRTSCSTHQDWSKLKKSSCYLKMTEKKYELVVSLKIQI